MSVLEAMAFQQLQRQAAELAAQVAQLTLEQAAMKEQLTALSAGECPVCAQRRAADAARQQRYRSRNGRDCSAKMP